MHKEFVLKIQNSQMKLVKKQSHRVKVYETEINNEVVHLVYDKSRKQIVTVYKPKR